MLDDTIDILTKQMIENDFNEKINKCHQTVRLTKTQLYQFCIKLVKLIKEVEKS